MYLNYTSNIEKDMFNVTDFNCSTSQQLLKQKGFYKIIWAREENLNLIIDGYDFRLDKSHLLFCTPLNVVQIDKEQKGAIALVFNREFYCIRDHDHEVSCNGVLFFGSSLPRVIFLNEKGESSYMMMFQILLEEFETKDTIQGEMLRVMLKRILIKSTRLVKLDIIQPELPTVKIDIIRRFNVLVEEHFKEKHQVSDYAAMLNKSPKTLSNLFKMYSDKTALAFINDRIITEARRLLLFSDKTSEQITYILGYNEPGHFSKFFKKQVGVSPTEFRKRHRLKQAKN
ncbi:helix-turn-helix domain-containing protein [Winogradskyella immobilis]|uniref:Helix-turn-helix domain-containing protein n=1 Tax=Winogradskyella immobilis TaxID=2816852 RepID=A0ABS8EKU2_9FLAO|nr:AraC family transcriptional regulator [Winogradskyella immobilis]MCC1483829.1 helix-turn-helix domain-containing protein [Winogradskyella immobilis]MCG0015923.1 AraC family transcriptional regulator [Winogradskyella immobilis]